LRHARNRASGYVILPCSSQVSKAIRCGAAERLQELGWVEGRNIRIERRWAQGDTVRMRALAKEFVTLQPDLIVSGNTPITAALLKETRTIPIVFTSVADLVGSGFVESLARPGGNVMGFATLEPSLGGTRGSARP